MLTIISSSKEPMYFTAKDFRFFNMAKRRAESNPYPQYPLAAVITQNGNLVSTGCNQEKTHTLQRRFNEYRVLAYAVDDAKIQHYIHAEMDAIRHALRHHHPSILEGRVYLHLPLQKGRSSRNGAPMWTPVWRP